MPQMIWKGHISFGLVSIPVALHPAEAREELDFTLLDREDMSPVGYRKVNKHTGEEVPRERITRGLEVAERRYVLVTEEDLRRASPERAQRIDILSFVESGEVDPRYYDRPYYLAPTAKQEKGYVLLREALRRSGKIGIATVVLRTRQHLAALTVHEAVLVLDLLRYASELRDSARLKLPTGSLKSYGISEKELQMGQTLIEEMVGPWDPEQYRDEYRHELMAFIQKRAKAGKLEKVEDVQEAGEPRKKPGKVIDIMTLLKQSVEKAGKPRPRARRRQSA